MRETESESPVAGPQARWLWLAERAITLLAAAAALYASIRILQVQRDNFFGFGLADDLRLTHLFNRPPNQLRGAGPSERVLAVDGKAVATREEAMALLRGAGERPAELLLESPSQPGGKSRVGWLSARAAPRIPLDGELRVAAGIAPELAALGLEGARVAEAQGSPLRSVTQCEKLLRQWPAIVALRLEAPAGAEAPLVGLMIMRASAWVHWLHVLIGVAYAALGVRAIRMKPGLRSSWAFFLFCAYTGLFFSLRAIPPPFRSEAERNAFMLVVGGSLAPVLYFLAVFTPLRLALPKRAPVGLACALPSAGLFAVGAIAGSTKAFLAWGVALLAIFVVALPMPLWLRMARPWAEPSDRQRAWIVSAAILLSFIPVTIYVVWMSLGGAPNWYHVAAEFTPLIFPALVGYAVVRQNFFQADEFLVESATFGGLAAALGGAYALLVAFVPEWIERRLAPGGGAWVARALAAGTAIAFVPAYAAARGSLEGRFYRRQSSYDELIESIKPLALRSESSAAFCRGIARQIMRIAASTAATLVELPPGPARPRLLGTTFAPILEEFDTVEAGRAAAALARRPGGATRMELADAVGPRIDDRHLAALMDASDAQLAFPLRTEGSVDGALLVGRKRVARNFSATEAGRLRQAAREIAVGLYGFAVRRHLLEKREAEEARAKLEEQLRHSQRLESIGTLAAGLAHDFGNVIAVLRPLLRLSRDAAAAGESAEDHLAMAEGAVDQAVRIARSVAELAGRRAPEHRPFDLGLVVASCMELLRRAFPAAVRIQVDLPPEPVWVHGDHGKLFQALMNLAINARDAMPDGGTLRISLAGERDEDGAPLAKLEAEDTGCGMDAETLARVFEGGFTTKPEGKGAGLGMSMVKRILAEHGGWIEAASEPGRGSRLTVWLPRCEAPAGAAREEAAWSGKSGS